MGGRGRDGEWWRGESVVEEEEEEEEGGESGESVGPSEWEEGWEGGEWRAGVDTQPIGYAPPAHTHTHTTIPKFLSLARGSRPFFFGCAYCGRNASAPPHPTPVSLISQP